jgi:hypothetical protein
MKQEGWDPDSDLKGSISNKPVIQNQTVKHRFFQNAKFHIILIQFRPSPVLANCFLMELILCCSEYCDGMIGIAVCYLGDPGFKYWP